MSIPSNTPIDTLQPVKMPSLTSPMAITLWQDAVAKYEAEISNAVAKYEAEISNAATDDEKKPLLQTDSGSLLEYALTLQDRYTAKRPNKILRALGPFLTRLKSCAAAVDVFIQVDPKIAGLIWGSLRLVLEFALNAYTVLENILEMFDEIMSTLPRFDTYASLFPADNGFLSQSMSRVFDDVIFFCAESIRYFSRNPYSNLIRSTWKPFEVEFGQTIKRMRHNTTLVEREAFACSIRADAERFRQLQQLLSNGMAKNVEAQLPCHCIPYSSNSRFFGREAILAAVNSHFQLHGTDAQFSFALYGMGGVGKTQIALRYVYENLANYQAVFWCHADTIPKLRESFVKSAIALGLQEDDADSKKCQESMIRWLETTDATWLLVLDNADDPGLLKEFWPSSKRGCILLTSRNPAAARDKTQSGIEVSPMKVDEASSFLLHQLSEDQSQEDTSLSLENAQKVVSVLGCLPLAICQVAAFSLETACHLDEVIGLLRDSTDQKEVLSQDGLVSSAYHSSSTAVAWDLSISALDVPSLDMLRLLSFLDPDHIPEQIFRCQASKSIARFSRSIGPGLSRIRAAGLLIRHSLIRKNKSDASITIHRLVQSAALEKLDQELRLEYFQAIVGLMWNVFPKQKLGCPMEEDWAQCRLYVNHVLALERHYRESFEDEPGLENLAEILFNCCWFMFEQGLYNEALVLAPTARRILDNASLGEGLVSADLYNTVAAIQLEQNNAIAARDNFAKAVDIHEKLLPPDHVHLANSYMNLGNALNGLQKYDESMKYHSKAVEIREKSPHLARIMLGLSYGNMGRLLMRMGRTGEAASVLEKSVVIRRDCLGSMSSKLANALHALGNVYIAQGRYEEAYPLHAESLNIRMTSLGGCSQTAASCHKLAWHLHRRKEYASCIELLTRAISMYRKYGENTGGIARSQYKLALVLHDSSRIVEAEEMKSRAARLRWSILDIPPDECDNEAGYDGLIMFVDH